jgi:hypothetical protein
MRSFKQYFSIVFKRRRGANAFWMGLFWVAFAHQGLDPLQIESAKVAKDRE